MFYPIVKFHDDPSFVQRLVTILVFNLWQCVGVSAVSDLDNFWPVGSSCGDLPFCKIL